MYHLNRPKNKQNIFVRNCITEAFFVLLQKYDFEKISISDIIRKAGVSRMGFYRNFSSKEDVVENFVFDKFVDTVNEIESIRPLKFDYINIIKTTLENFLKFANYIKLFLDKNLDGLLYKCYRNAYYSLNPTNKQDAIHKYYNEIFIGELYNMEMCWLKNGMKETPSKLARIFCNIIKLQEKQFNKIA